jgi:hypothetical protein
MLEVGLSSTLRIAAFFGIAPEEQEKPARTRVAEAAPLPRTSAESGSPGGVQQVIEKALKAAGLMK